MTTAISRIPDGDDVWGRDREVVKDFALSGTYAALVIKASDVGLKFFRAVIVAGGDTSLGTYFPVVDLGNGSAFVGTISTSATLHLYTASGTEATGALSPSVNLRLCFIGG